jgi:hypothetical protein
VFKDNDFNRVLFLGPEKRDLLLKQIESDVNVKFEKKVRIEFLLVFVENECDGL